MPIIEIKSVLMQQQLIMDACKTIPIEANTIMLVDGHGFNFTETLSSVRDYHQVVVFFEYNEASTLQQIEDHIKNNPILEGKRIILINNDFNGWHQVVNTGLDIEFGLYPDAFIRGQNYQKKKVSSSPDQVSRDFVNTSFKVRWSKIIALMALDSENLLDHGYVSMSDRKFKPSPVLQWHEYPTTQQHVMEILNCHWGKNYCQSVKSWIVRQADLLQKKLPLMLDIDFRNRDDWKFRDIGYTNTVDPYLQDSWFDVVVEDAVPQLVMDDDVVIFTEKTVKSIAWGRPFLLYGKPGQLDALRQLGFRTFSPWFDESYDDVDHHIHRAQHLARCVKKICELSLSDKMKIWNELQEITAHNQKNLFTIKNKIYWKPIKEFKWK